MWKLLWKNINLGPGNFLQKLSSLYVLFINCHHRLVRSMENRKVEGGRQAAQPAFRRLVPTEQCAHEQMLSFPGHEQPACFCQSSLPPYCIYEKSLILLIEASLWNNPSQSLLQTPLSDHDLISASIHSIQLKFIFRFPNYIQLS